VIELSDLPDYRREIVIVESVELDVVGSATVDLIKVGGVAIATPTVTACVPVSIENEAIAYDGVNDRFTVDIEKWSAAETVNVSVQNATLAVTQSGTWTVIISGTVTITGTVAATQSGTWNIATLTSITNTVNVAIASSVTITVTGAVTVSGTVLTDIETNTDALVKTATTPAIYNVTMTSADTEYTQALPANTKKFLVQCRDGTAFRLAFETGKVATPTEPYLTVATDAVYYEDEVLSSATVYVGCGSAGKVVEILAWT
jgi:hypothetical protein